MQTKKWNMKQNINEEILIEAIELIKNGELVAFPTETVYGLGADATNDNAIKKIFQAKGRPSDNPLIVHVATIEQMKQYVKEIPAYVGKLLQEFSPGPITYVLKSNGVIASSVTAGLDTIAIRIPSDPIANGLIKLSQLPIAAPSANISGKPSPTTAEHVIDDMDGRIAGIIDGGSTDGGIESTVIDCTGDAPVVLRLGGISVTKINEIIKVRTEVENSNNGEQLTPKSPGVKYKHYAPDVPLMVVIENKKELQKIIKGKKLLGYKIGLIWTGDQIDSFENVDKVIFIGATPKEIAQGLYSSFRKFKKNNVDIVICFIQSSKQAGQAILDRVKRAATIFYQDES